GCGLSWHGGLAWRISLPERAPGLSRRLDVTLSAYDHFADLDDRGLVSVVRDVRHDLFRMGSKTCLKRLDRVAEDMAHPNIGCRCVRRSAGKTFVNRVVLAFVA